MKSFFPLPFPLVAFYCISRSILFWRNFHLLIFRFSVGVARVSRTQPFVIHLCLISFYFFLQQLFVSLYLKLITLLFRTPNVFSVRFPFFPGMIFDYKNFYLFCLPRFTFLINIYFFCFQIFCRMTFSFTISALNRCKQIIGNISEKEAEGGETESIQN